jgi:hypothetical protein
MILALEKPPVLTPALQILIAVMTLLTIACFFTILWLTAQMADLRERLDVLDDAATPSFIEKKPEPVKGPPTVEDLKQASKIPPPDLPTKEFSGLGGKKHTFQFKGEET